MSTLSPALIIADEIDGPVADVCTVLDERDYPYFLFQPSLTSSLDTAFSVHYRNGRLEAELVAGAQGSLVRVAINPDTRIWCRKPQYPGMAVELDKDGEVSRFIRNQYRISLDSLYSAPALWMNDVRSERRIDQNKPIQAEIAARSGLVAIPTLCTDDPDSFARFVQSLENDEGVAIKAPAAWMAQVENTSTVVGTYTRHFTRKAAMGIASAVRRAPVLVQPYVEKKYELRVTVVDERIFACKIDSQATLCTKVDWRHYDLENTPHEAVVLDVDLDKAILTFMRKANLRFACIDLIVAPNGVTYFVEANPCGAFGWIETLTGIPITEAIADWLTV